MRTHVTGSGPGTGVQDLRAMRELLAEAYADDPLMHWIFPDATTRVSAIAAWLGLFAESYLAYGDVDTVRSANVDAIACWRRPGDILTGPEAPSFGELLAALVGSDHAASVGSGLAATRELTPPGDYVYLHFLAVRADSRGRGLGRHLVERGIAKAAESGFPVHLETTSEPAVRFYQSVGFEITGELDLPGRGPHLWAMGRRWA